MIGTVHIIESDAPVRIVVLMGEHDVSTEADVHRALEELARPTTRRPSSTSTTERPHNRTRVKAPFKGTPPMVADVRRFAES